MKFFIHDKCFDQLIELPKAVQKKVLDFQRKFREHSRAAAIHLEPISTFRDPNLRTARISDKYRAIIKVPQSGDDYHMLWIDNHDEAMAWAENKVFEWNESTQSAQLFTAAPPLAELPREAVAAPKSSASALYAAYTDAQLLALGVPQQHLPLVTGVPDFNGLDLIEQYLPPAVYENLFYLADGAIYERLLEEIEAGKSKSAAYDDQLLSLNNRRSFLEVDDALLEEVLKGETSKWQLFLHPSQRKLVESQFNGPVKVTGGGGTGKTVVALHRLQRLTAALPAGAPKVLFTTYTVTLTDNLRELARKLGPDPESFDLDNVDALARRLALSTRIIDENSRVLDLYGNRRSQELWDEALDRIPSEFDAVFMKKEYQDVILLHGNNQLPDYLKQSRIGRGQPITRKQRLAVWQIVEEYHQLKRAGNYLDRAELFNRLSDHYNALPADQKPYSHVIADEVQDMANVELRFLRSLVGSHADDLFLVGDPYQKIYGRRTNFSAAGINIRGNRSRRLRLNYRTTEEIKRLAISAVRGFGYDDFDGSAEKMDGYLSLMHGSKPTYLQFKEKSEELKYLGEEVHQLIRSGLRPSDIVIACRTKDPLRDIKSSLHQLQIPYFDLTSVSGEITGVRLSTFHRLKGLEFKAVFLADVTERTCPFIPAELRDLEGEEREEHLQAERALLYVAITRAVQQVVLTGTGTPTTILRLT
jgi:hypothetical protein